MDELLRLGLRRNHPLVEQQGNTTSPPNLDSSHLQNNSSPIPARRIPRPPPNSPAQRRPNRLQNRGGRQVQNNVQEPNNRQQTQVDRAEALTPQNPHRRPHQNSGSIAEGGYGANGGRQALLDDDPGTGTTQAPLQNRLTLQLTINGQHVQQQNGLAQEQPRPDLPGAQQDAPPGNVMQDGDDIAAAATIRPQDRARTNAETETNGQENINSMAQQLRVEQVPIPTQIDSIPGLQQINQPPQNRARAPGFEEIQSASTQPPSNILDDEGPVPVEFRDRQDEHEGAPPMVPENRLQRPSMDQDSATAGPQNRQEDPPARGPLNRQEDPPAPEPLNRQDPPAPEPLNRQDPPAPGPLNRLQDPNPEPQNRQQRTVNQNRPQNRPSVAAAPRPQNRQQGMVRQTPNRQQTPQYGPVFGPQNRPRRGVHPRPTGNQNRSRAVVVQNTNRAAEPVRPRYRPQDTETRRPLHAARGAQARSASEGAAQGNERIRNRRGTHRISLDSRPPWRY